MLSHNMYKGRETITFCFNVKIYAVQIYPFFGWLKKAHFNDNWRLTCFTKLLCRNLSKYGNYDLCIYDYIVRKEHVKKLFSKDIPFGYNRNQLV